MYNNIWRLPQQGSEKTQTLPRLREAGLSKLIAKCSLLIVDMVADAAHQDNLKFIEWAFDGAWRFALHKRRDKPWTERGDRLLEQLSGGNLTECEGKVILAVINGVALMSQSPVNVFIVERFAEDTRVSDAILEECNGPTKLWLRKDNSPELLRQLLEAGIEQRAARLLLASAERVVAESHDIICHYLVEEYGAVEDSLGALRRSV